MDIYIVCRNKDNVDSSKIISRFVLELFLKLTLPREIVTILWLVTPQFLLLNEVFILPTLRCPLHTDTEIWLGVTKLSQLTSDRRCKLCTSLRPARWSNLFQVFHLCNSFKIVTYICAIKVDIDDFVQMYIQLKRSSREQVISQVKTINVKISSDDSDTADYRRVRKEVNREQREQRTDVRQWLGEFIIAITHKSHLRAAGHIVMCCIIFSSHNLSPLPPPHPPSHIIPIVFTAGLFH